MPEHCHYAMSTYEQTILEEQSWKLGFLGSYLMENHPFSWRLGYPFDVVVSPATPEEAQTLCVIGVVRSNLCQLDALGEYIRDNRVAPN